MIELTIGREYEVFHVDYATVGVQSAIYDSYGVWQLIGWTQRKLKFTNNHSAELSIPFDSIADAPADPWLIKYTDEEMDE